MVMEATVNPLVTHSELLGLNPQSFSRESDPEEDATVETTPAKGAKVAKKIAGNVLKGALCGVHGFFFGISSCIATRVQDRLHEERVLKGEGVTICIKVVSVSNLHSRTIGGKQLPLTPVIRAKLLMEGLNVGPENQVIISPGIRVDKTQNPDGKIIFDKEKKENEGCLLMPVVDLEAVNNALLAITIEDTPVVLGTVATVVKGNGFQGRDLTIGSAVLSLRELLVSANINPANFGVATVNENLPAKLDLWSGESYQEPAGSISVSIGVRA